MGYSFNSVLLTFFSILAEEEPGSQHNNIHIEYTRGHALIALQ
jgi:hypothetical protein